MSFKSILASLAIIVFLNVFAIPEAHSQVIARTKKVERKMAGKKRKAPKEAKVRQPKVVLKAQKKQQKKEDKLKKDYEKSIKKTRSRHYNMQSEDVKMRMKQNELDIKIRDKERKKEENKKGRTKTG